MTDVKDGLLLWPQTDSWPAMREDPPAEIADGLRPLLALGFRHVPVDMPAPYDLETIERIGEVVEQFR